MQKFDYEVYTGNDLGAVYSPKMTRFKVWAPEAESVKLNLYKQGEGDNLIEQHIMKKSANGTYVFEKQGDCNGIYYTYTVVNHREEQEAVDPYTKAAGVNGQRGMVINLAKTNPQGFELDGYRNPEHITDAIVYEGSVRDFTMDESSGVFHNGKFLGLTEANTTNHFGEATALDYISGLGVTHVQILPAFDFETVDEKNQKAQYNWGYDPDNYNVPEGSYAVSPYDGTVRIQEMKQMVLALHSRGIGVIMDVVFNHTYRRDDSNLQKIVPGYYYRSDETGYTDGSGCGNEVASDRPMVQKLIVDSLIYWAKEYHVDGFRLMGANLPIRAMAQDLILCRSKLFADTIPEDLLEQDYAYPHLFVYRDEFYYPLRKMLNHKEICLTDFVNQMRKQKKYAGFVNYAASNDGFTLADVFMYSEKHNEANGENNADGNDWNYSDNYGIEGPTRKKYIESLRKKQLRNAITAVFLAQGIPLLAAGDEIGNSQRGNNNAYCQDNAVGWVNWKNDKKYASLQQFVKKMAAFRKAHPVLRMEEPMRMNDYKGLGYPDLSFHCDSAWTVGFSPNRQSVGMLYCGLYADCEEMIYVAYNFHTGKQFLALPKLPKSKKWYKVMDTGNENGFLEKEMIMDAVQVEIAGMSIQILIGK